MVQSSTQTEDDCIIRLGITNILCRRAEHSFKTDLKDFSLIACYLKRNFYLFYFYSLLKTQVSFLLSLQVHFSTKIFLLKFSHKND